MPEWARERFPLPTGASDAFPAPSIAQKHTRWVLCPLDEKFYIFGGDFGSAWQGMQSGQNSLLSYHPPTRAWAIEYPFWGKPGEHYPMHMDEVAVCWDSKRNLFWLTNGYQGGATAEDVAHAVGIQTRTIVQAFDPISKRWELPFGQLKFAYGQTNRTVHDPVSDRIYGFYYNGAWGTAVAIFNPNDGATEHKAILGIGNVHPSTGQTVHQIGRKIYFWDGKNLFYIDLGEPRDRVGRFTGHLVATPGPMYADQDNSYIPELDSFLVWTETPPSSHLIDRSSGVITDGPESPLLSDGTGYRPQNNNRHPSGVVVIGWSAAPTVHGRQVPEYWHYSLANVAQPSSSPKRKASSIRAAITTAAQTFPNSTQPAIYRFGLSGPQNRLVDVPYGGAIQARFDHIVEGNYTVTVELLDSAGKRLGNLLSQQVRVAEADIVLQGLFGITPGIRIRRAAENSDD